MAPRIEARTLKGFSDELPERAILKERCIEVAKRVFRDFGFAPIETPALEYSEVLLGKLDPDSEVQRQIYRFRDHGDRDVALRFDLTVPFARFAAQHRQAIGMPFRRYHIGPVWRGENPQAGRRREFLQCDIDIIGTASAAADGEVLAVVCHLMGALDVDRYELRVNDRRLLLSKFAEAGVTAGLEPVLRVVDKLEKQGPVAVADELERIGLSSDATRAVLDVCAIRGQAVELLQTLGTEAEHLREVVDVAVAAGADPSKLVLDLSIARPRLLHGHCLRDIPGRPTRDREHLLGRPLRRPCRAVRQGTSSRRRRIAGADAPHRCVGATRAARRGAEHARLSLIHI